MTNKNKTQLDAQGLAIADGYFIVYNINQSTREFTAASDEFLAAGVGIPACAYIDAPPKTKPGFAICRSADGGRWQSLPDHRGEKRYSTLTGEPITLHAPGDYPADTAALAPTSKFAQWNGAAWVTDNDKLAASACRYRNNFITATDRLTLVDYSINDKPLTTMQRSELMAARAAYKAWPALKNWPQIELPAVPRWLLVEAVNNGYIVPEWPLEK